MGASGSTIIDFGSTGAYDATVVVTGQLGIVSGSLVEVWVMPIVTADHSEDEHVIDPPLVNFGSIVAGTGFTIRGNARHTNPIGGPFVQWADHPKHYGKWTIGWVWV